MNLIICIFLLFNNVGNDKNLTKLNKNLPAGWKIKYSGGKMIIYNTTPVYVLFQNMINAPVSMESEKDRIKRIKKYGRKTISSITLKYEKKWSARKISEAKNFNKEILKKIQLLAANPDLKKVFNLRTKHTPEILAEKYGKTKEYNLFKKQKLALEKKLIKLPNFESEYYSLWLSETAGVSNAYNLVHPFKISTENYHITNLLKKYLKETGF